MVQNKDKPAMAWLWMANYMHGWLEWELGGEVIIYGKRVLSVQHLPGARAILRMTAEEDIMEPAGKWTAVKSMSVTRRNCIEAGMKLDAEATTELYGVRRDDLGLFLPIECPKMCITPFGVLRPWTWDVTFGKRQTGKLSQLLRTEFWKAVEKFDRKFAEELGGRRYTAKEMAGAWCAATKTSDVYLDEIRREWQRRLKKERKE